MAGVKISDLPSAEFALDDMQLEVNDAGVSRRVTVGQVRPDLAAVATTGAYDDLSGTPTLATVATTGAYADLSGRPALATVATTGAYADLSGKPTLGTAAATDATDYATSAQGALADTAVQPASIAKMVVSDTTGIAGADAITNIVSLTQAEYDAIGTPDAGTLYVITE